MVRRVFKNALCQAPIPDYPYGPDCRRRSEHSGSHRVVFRDGGVREWDDGDLESRLTTKGYK